MVSEHSLLNSGLIYAPNPLEQFILLAKTAKGAAAANLVAQAMNSPAVYVFAELLHVPNVAELAGNADFRSYYDLLNIYAYGTYTDYVQNKEKFNSVPVTDSMIMKLRQLTVVTLAIRNKRLPYVLLSEQLELPNVRELEDLIIDGIYNGVIVGKLDQRNQRLEVERCMGRDVKDEQLNDIVLTLDSFNQRCHKSINCMEEQITGANAARIEALQNKQKVDQEFNNIKKKLKAAGMTQGGGNNGMADLYDNNFMQDVSSSSVAAAGHRQSAGFEPPEKKKDKNAPRRTLRSTGRKN